MIKIDVLMSTYNDEKYIRASVESILEQDYERFQFIIIDDCSTDKTCIIIEEYAKRDNRIKLIKNSENMGLSYNLNKGVKMSNADYIMRMDADDISHLNRLSIMIKELEKHPDVDILGSFANLIDQEGRFKGVRKVPLKNDNIYKLLWTCPFIHPSVIYKRKSILEVGNYNKKLRRRQDYELWFRCAENSLKFMNLSKVLLDYRIEPEKYYIKNNYAVNLIQFKIGIRGSWNNSLGVASYIGVSVNFLSQLLPKKFKWHLRKIKDYLMEQLGK